MEEHGMKCKLIPRHFKNYIENKKELEKLKIADKTSSAISSTALYATLAIVGVFALLLLSFALAYGLGALLNNYFLGFLIVALAYASTGTALWYNKGKAFKLPILNALIQKMYNKEGLDHGAV